MPQLKGYKVSNCDRSRTCGIAALNLEDLKKKTCIKFNLNEPVDFFLQDGTLVDCEDYFRTLPQQTVFIVGSKNQKILTGADIIYNALSSVSLETLRAGKMAKDFLSDNIKEKVNILTKVLTAKKSKDDKTMFSNKSQHPEWFRGLDSRCSTKEAVMAGKCRDRMRGYLYKAKSDIRNSDDYREASSVLDAALDLIGVKLKEANANGHYFDRSRTGEEKLCDKMGQFTCHGLWNKDQCPYLGLEDFQADKKHVINPYESWEARIVFSTWNLDHRIEKSRSVIPCLLEVAKKLKDEPKCCFRVNIDYFYRMLFTRDNLKLVHIVCHDKGAHSASCDLSSALLPPCNNCKKKSPKKEIQTQSSKTVRLTA